MPDGNKRAYRVAVMTASDKGAAGEREDLSGKWICDYVLENGYTLASYIVLPDEMALLRQEMARICDENAADLILTTGGTGFSVRDCMPEATKAIAERDAPGIAEAMRAYSMGVTNRAMLSRAVSVIRKSTLIVNMPGSLKAVRECLSFILPTLSHGLDILTGSDGECGQAVLQ